MKKVKNFWKRFKGPTPLKWKRIATTFFSLSGVFTASYTSVTALQITMPEWFGMFIGFAVAICIIIATYAQQHQIK